MPDTYVNVRSEEFFLAETGTVCRACGFTTRVLGFALPPGHERRVEEDEIADATADEAGDKSRDKRREESRDTSTDETALSSVPPKQTWERSHSSAFIFLIRELSPSAVRRCQAALPHFRLADDAADLGPHWANHCERCGALQDDQELHGEPDAAFIPTSEDRAPRIRLRRIGEMLEAGVGGYAFEPQFFDRMSVE